MRRMSIWIGVALALSASFRALQTAVRMPHVVEPRYGRNCHASCKARQKLNTAAMRRWKRKRRNIRLHPRGAR